MAQMLHLTLARETAAEETIRNYVLTRARLGIYDPLQPRRPRRDVISFDIEILEFDEAEAIAHAAGPIVLRTPQGDVEQFLRISVPIQFDGECCLIPEGAAVRAVYIIDADHPNGACKEAAALANELG